MSVVYSAECKAAQKANRSISMLPILIVLFVFSYAILTMLVFEQGQTIESQRGLIREMLKDSTQLAAIKAKGAREESLRANEKPSTAGEVKKDSAPKAIDKNGRAGKPAKPLNEIPGKPASDLQDVRRSTRVI